MSRILKTAAALVFTAAVLAPPVSWAADSKSDDSAAAGPADASGGHDRTFEETREFMKKHSEESKKTGKM